MCMRTIFLSLESLIIANCYRIYLGHLILINLWCSHVEMGVEFEHLPLSSTSHLNLVRAIVRESAHIKCIYRHNIIMPPPPTIGVHQRFFLKPLNYKWWLFSLSKFGYMLSVGAIHFENRFLEERVGQEETGGCTTLGDSAWRMLQLAIEKAWSTLDGPFFCFLVKQA